MIYIDGGVTLKFHTITALKHISSFSSHNVCFIKLGALILGAHKLIIFIFYCFINPSVRNSLFLLVLVLKCTLLDIAKVYIFLKGHFIFLICSLFLKI